MPNQLQIAHYLNYYQQTLEQFKFSVCSQQLKVLVPVINLIFEVDSLYDFKDSLFSHSEVENLKEKMSNLLSESSQITQPAIDHFFQALEEEAQTTNFNSLTEYLQVSRYSIGAEILCNYIAYLLDINPQIWFSEQITRFKTEIYTLIRLANDYLDIKEDLPRKEQEKDQIKATHFFANLILFKVYFLWRYTLHKVHYYYYLVTYNFCRDAQEKENYLQAIKCSESILTWAYKVYVIDHNSVHDF